MLLDSQIKESLLKYHVIAVVGLSNDSERHSYKVAMYLKNQGYKIVPINPKCVVVLNEKCYPDLVAAQTDLGTNKIEIVDIFRKPEYVPTHIEESIKIGAKLIWMQQGIEHKVAAAKAEQAGLQVIMDRCIMEEHKRLLL